MKSPMIDPEIQSFDEFQDGWLDDHVTRGFLPRILNLENARFPVANENLIEFSLGRPQP